MRKNRMMRLASALLILTMVTTCAISGTFAKYVTSVTGTDTARVAKWGITMKSTGNDTFVATYDSSVEAANGTDDLVAPGTAKTAVYEIAGQPETDYVVTFDGEKTNDVYLGAGTYAYEPDANDNVIYNGMDKTIAAGSEYYPIKYTLKIETTDGTPTGFTAGTVNSYDTLEQAMAAIDGFKVTFDANEECDVKVTFGWNWAFEGQDDIADTILGDLMAGNDDLIKSDGAAYDLNVAYSIKMTATQLD